jgi:hypothetical protein
VLFLYFVSSLELYWKWKPINLDHPDKSKTKKPHRNESSKKKISNSSDKEILKSSLSPPKKPRLESQIKVQTPPPSDDNVNHFLYHTILYLFINLEIDQTKSN